MDLGRASDALGPMFQAISDDAARTLRSLDLTPQAKVLDVGTGQGFFAICLAMHGFDVLTGEPATDESRYARRPWERNAEMVGVLDSIRFHAFDATDMPFADKLFDAVFFFGVLHHIDEEQRESVFREALRVAGASGAVVFFEPKAETLKKVWRSDPGHPSAANPSDYASGFDVAETKTTGSLMEIYAYRKALGDESKSRGW